MSFFKSSLKKFYYDSFYPLSKYIVFTEKVYDINAYVFHSIKLWNQKRNLDVVLDKCFNLRIYLVRRKFTHTETANKLKKCMD